MTLLTGLLGRGLGTGLLGLRHRDRHGVLLLQVRDELFPHLLLPGLGGRLLRLGLGLLEGLRGGGGALLHLDEVVAVDALHGRADLAQGLGLHGLGEGGIHGLGVEVLVEAALVGARGVIAVLLDQVLQLAAGLQALLDLGDLLLRLDLAHALALGRGSLDHHEDVPGRGLGGGGEVLGVGVVVGLHLRVAHLHLRLEGRGLGAQVFPGQQVVLGLGQGTEVLRGLVQALGLRLQGQELALHDAVDQLLLRPLDDLDHHLLLLGQLGEHGLEVRLGDDGGAHLGQDDVLGLRRRRRLGGRGLRGGRSRGLGLGRRGRLGGEGQGEEAEEDRAHGRLRRGSSGLAPAVGDRGKTGGREAPERECC